MSDREKERDETGGRREAPSAVPGDKRVRPWRRHAANRLRGQVPRETRKEDQTS